MFAGDGATWPGCSCSHACCQSLSEAPSQWVHWWYGKSSHRKASQGETGSGSQARTICTPNLWKTTYRSKGSLHHCHNHCSLLGAIKPASVPGIRYLPLSEQGVTSQNPVASLSRIPSLPTTDASRYQVLNTSPFILSSTPKGKCYYPWFTDEENKGEESTGRSFESEFAVEPGFKLTFPGLHRQCSSCYSHSPPPVQALPCGLVQGFPT